MANPLFMRVLEPDNLKEVAEGGSGIGYKSANLLLLRQLIAKLRKLGVHAIVPEFLPLAY